MATFKQLEQRIADLEGENARLRLMAAPTREEFERRVLEGQGHIAGLVQRLRTTWEAVGRQEAIEQAIDIVRTGQCEREGDIVEKLQELYPPDSAFLGGR